MVVCEKDALSNIPSAVTWEYGVPLVPVSGFCAGFIHQVARRHIDPIDPEIPLVLYYLGDYDPAGVLIDRDIEAKLREHLRSEGVDNPLAFHRLTITPEQIAEYDLPTKPRKEGERRAPHIAETVEAEAMDPTILRTMLRDLVESFMPPRALEVTRVAEESERDYLRMLADLEEDDA